ncbi:hypothetical protein D3C72_1184850 [compost metagenome]
MRVLAQNRDRRDCGVVHRIHCAVQVCTAAILPGIGSPGVDGRSETGRRCFAEQYRRRGQTPRSAAQGQGRDRQLRGLRRHRFAAFLPAAGSATAGGELRPVCRPGENHRRTGSPAHLVDLNPQRAIPRSTLAGHAPGKRSAGWLPGTVPRDRGAHRGGAGAGAQSRGQGSREPACGQRPPRLGRTEQGGVPEHRSGPRAGAGREHGEPVEVPAKLPDRFQCQPVP